MKIVNIVVNRRHHKKHYIIGDMSVAIDGHEPIHICNSLENTLKAIPKGMYVLEPHALAKFDGKIFPELIDVPHREGIFIHPGNTFKDTTGCILPGINSATGEVRQSVSHAELFTYFVLCAGVHNIIIEEDYGFDEDEENYDGISRGSAFTVR
jgi:hypothetical protein